MRTNARAVVRKLNTSAGFTLAEALVTVLILLMVSSVVAAGIPAAKNAYEKVVLASNAEVLLSTTISTLRNELGTANSVQVDADGVTIKYFNPSINSSSVITKNAKGQVAGDLSDVIVYQRYAGTNISDGKESVKTTAFERLISKTASTEGLYVTYESVKGNGDGTISFKNLWVNQAANGTKTKEKIARRDVLSIRVISYVNSY